LYRKNPEVGTVTAIKRWSIANKTENHKKQTHISFSSVDECYGCTWQGYAPVPAGIFSELAIAKQKTT
jgi:hypothetical protein